LNVFPMDSTWYQFSVALGDITASGNFDTLMDSLVLTFSPTLLTETSGGYLQIGDVVLVDDGQLIAQFPSGEDLGWQPISALNGSYLGISDCPAPSDIPESSAMELYFYNDWQGPAHFAGFAQFTLNLEQGLILTPDMRLEFWLRTYHTPVSTRSEPAIQPETFGIVKAYPNPFNGSVAMELNLPQVSAVAQLQIYNLRGEIQLVTDIPAGAQDWTWHGMSGSGQPLPSGVYLARLYADGRATGQAIKLLLLK